jgi:hypothetical protein
VSAIIKAFDRVNAGPARLSRDALEALG